VLVAEAREFWAEHPDLEQVGLILECSSAEAKPFLVALERAAGKRIEVAGFLGIVPRRFAIDILRNNAPAALDNLPNGKLGVTLPVLVATRSGFRFGEIDTGK